jgi:hypothetical protein
MLLIRLHIFVVQLHVLNVSVSKSPSFFSLFFPRFMFSHLLFMLKKATSTSQTLGVLLYL